MNIKQSKKQLAVIASIIGAGIVLALLILFVKSNPGAKERAEDGHAEASEQKPAVTKETDEHSEEKTAGTTPHAKEEEHTETIKLTDAQIKAAGITLLQAAPAVIHTSITLPGEIRFNEDRTAQVVPLLGGIVQVVQANIGQAVKKGQVLAVIASTELSDQRSQLLTAEKRLAVARTTFAREKKLWEEKISAEQDYIQARQAMQEAEIEQNNAQQKLRALGSNRGATSSLNSYELRAPFDGMVIEKHISLGQSVKPDSVLFTVSDLTTVWAEVAVPASDLGNVRVGEKVVVKASAFDAKVNGKVAYVGSLLGTQTRTATARIVLANPNTAWRPGMFVNVDVETSSDQREVPVAVNASGVQTVENKPTVFVRVPGGFTAQPVTLGRADATNVEVNAGLASGREYAAAGSFVIKAELGKSSEGDEH
jgi:cobalt-zinc-cadmium efflux system membrane fusion protein